MQNTFGSEDHLNAVRNSLLEPQSDDLIRFMQRKSLAWDTMDMSPDVADLAKGLGWITDPDERLTSTGFLAADSCREYRFWVERDKNLPFENTAPHLRRDYFQGRSVLEIGSGMGANLMSLASAGATAYGVDPVESYIRFGEVFSEREGIPVPDVRLGSAEVLPFENDAFDLVLCVTAHQYFDIHAAFLEIGRVLKPGGELIIVGSTFGEYFRQALSEIGVRRDAVKTLAVTSVNSFSYMTLGRRIVASRDGASTSRPVYPSKKWMRKWLRSSGMQEASSCIKVGLDSCFHSRLGARE